MTENLNSRGFLCLSDKPYMPGDELYATLELPAPYWYGGLKGCLTLQCQVEVVRVKGQDFGIACRIKGYTVLGQLASRSS